MDLPKKPAMNFERKEVSVQDDVLRRFDEYEKSRYESSRVFESEIDLKSPMHEDLKSPVHVGSYCWNPSSSGAEENMPLSLQHKSKDIENLHPIYADRSPPSSFYDDEYGIDDDDDDYDDEYGIDDYDDDDDEDDDEFLLNFLSGYVVFSRYMENNQPPINRSPINQSPINQSQTNHSHLLKKRYLKMNSSSDKRYVTKVNNMNVKPIEEVIDFIEGNNINKINKSDVSIDFDDVDRTTKMFQTSKQYCGNNNNSSNNNNKNYKEHTNEKYNTKHEDYDTALGPILSLILQQPQYELPKDTRYWNVFMF